MAAIFTILLWGTTFISTKILLRDFAPAEILIIRFVMGLIALVIACPKPIRGTPGTDLRRSRPFRDHPVLFAGKYRFDSYDGI